jgi:hypothetical protein
LRGDQVVNECGQIRRSGEKPLHKFGAGILLLALLLLLFRFGILGWLFDYSGHDFTCLKL